MAQIEFDKKLTNGVYYLTPSVANLTVLEQTLIEDFGEPSVTLGGLVDVISTCEPLTVASITGTFIQGEVLNGPSATAKVFFVNTTANIIYVTNRSGTFSASQTLTGSVSNATATFVSMGSPVATFTARYGTPPLSPTNFSVPLVVRSVPSTLNGTTYTFDSRINPNAENNAKDMELIIRVLVSEAWQRLLAKSDNWEGKDYYPL